LKKQYGLLFFIFLLINILNVYAYDQPQNKKNEEIFGEWVLVSGISYDTNYTKELAETHKLIAPKVLYDFKDDYTLLIKDIDYSMRIKSKGYYVADYELLTIENSIISDVIRIKDVYYSYIKIRDGLLMLFDTDVIINMPDKDYLYKVPNDFPENGIKVFIQYFGYCNISYLVKKTMITDDYNFTTDVFK